MDKAKLEDDLLKGVEAIFSKSGLLSKHGMFYHKRQHEYARSVATGLARGTDAMASMTLLEAATGTGKTIAYSIPLALYAVFTKSRVAISTFTLHLQRQIMQKDLPLAIKLVKEYLDVELTAARRIGVRNFVSYSRVLETMSDIKREIGDDEEWAMLQELLKFAKDSTQEKSSSSGEIAQFLEDKALFRLPYDITNEHICISPDSPAIEKMAYNLHCDEARMADIVVTSHAITVLHTKSSFNLLDNDVPVSAMVFDEADRFPEAAQQMLGERVPVSRVRSFLSKIPHPAFEACTESALKLESSLRDLRDKHDGSRIISVSPGNKRVCKAISRFSKDMQSLIEQVALPKNDGQMQLIKLDKMVKESLANLVDFSYRMMIMAKEFSGKGNPKKTMETHVSFSPCRNNPTLSIMPTNPGYYLSKLWLPRKSKEGDESSLYLKSVLMTSATLGDPACQDISNRFKRFMYECGIFDEARVKPLEEDGKEDPDVPVEKKVVLQLNRDLFASYEPSIFGKLEFILADPRLPHPLLKNDMDLGDDEDEAYAIPNPAWLDYVVNAIRYAAVDRRGLTLVLTNSYKDAKALAEKLELLPEGVKPDCLLVHSKKTKLNDLIGTFKRSANGVLITPGGWEGLNLVSSETNKGLIKNLIITRLPYGGKDEVKIGIYERVLIQRGKTLEEAKAATFLAASAAARKKLMQGIGRGVRSYYDHCRVFITDPRFPLVDNLRSKQEFGLSKVRVNKSFHACVPSRFYPALEKAQVLRMDGSIFNV